MKSKQLGILSLFLFLLFAVFTAVVSHIDVQPVGPEGSAVGLATLNQFFLTRAGSHLLWYRITEWLGMIALLFALGFALLGLVQLICRKGLHKVDRQLLYLGGFYLLVAAVYLLFEQVVINYRPVILDAGLEASYPSSHTMFVICIMASAMVEFRRLLPGRKPLLFVLEGISVLSMIITVVGRLLSGVHWFTDIVAGILLAAALVTLYLFACSTIRRQPES